MNYYNEFDSKAADWLRALIAERLIPAGHVDTRSIVDVHPADLEGYTQCHFFAGIAGWPLALKLAGWPEAKGVWSASCPCQPLSCAGLGEGHADERHLWPALYRLIAERGPAIVIGEQVASKDGREWFAGIRADLEGVGYAVGGADLCSAGVGAPNIRQRLYWVAVAEHAEQWSEQSESGARGGRGGLGGSSRMGEPIRTGLQGHAGHGDAGHEPGRLDSGAAGPTAAAGDTGGLADTHGKQGDGAGLSASHDSRKLEGAKELRNFWGDAVWHPCSDGKLRRIPVEPAFFPLAARLPGRVAMLKGFGNAINPQLAAEFIRSVMECL